MTKKINKTILTFMLETFKPKNKIKFIDNATTFLAIFGEIPIFLGVIVSGIFFDRLYLGLFSLFSIVFFRRKGGDHSPFQIGNIQKR